MDNDEIKRRINSFPSWHYQFDLKGNLTPIHAKRNINRHRERKKYFFDPLVHHLGGSLAGKRVLDLGCNAGFWSLCAIEAGCDFVLGIDGRQMHTDQANFVFQIKEVGRHRHQFITANIFDLDFVKFGTFDIVLCLGLMYHISKPMLLVEKMAELNTDMLVIDTKLSIATGSYLELLHENIEVPVNAVDYELVMCPTRRAVREMTRQFGYSIAVLDPQFHSYRGAYDYQLGFRRAFLCAKKTDLSSLPVPVEPVDQRTQSSHIPTRIAQKIIRFAGKLRDR